MSKKKKDLSGFIELGETAPSTFGNTIGGEFIQDLTGTKGIKTYKQMSMNDPIISAALFYYRMFIKSAKWDFIPASTSSQDKEAAEFLDSCMHDMTYSLDSLMNNICTFLTFGWANTELVFKIRDGIDSSYDDGLVGIKKLSLLPQTTCAGWEISKHGTIKGMWQSAFPAYQKKFIPITKTLLFRTTDEGNIPTGRSLLRGCYTSWYFSSQLREIESIKEERNAVGCPVMYAPAEVVEGAGEYAAKKTALIKLLTNLRVDEQMAVILPNSAEGEGYKLELLPSPGNYASEIGKIIERYDTRMAQSMASDFIMLGHGAIGSFALAKSNRGGSELARLGFLDSIADVLNSHLVPRLMKANAKFTNLKEFPKFSYNVAKIPSLDEVARMVNAMARANIDVASKEEVVNHLLSEIGAPVIPAVKESDEAKEHEEITIEEESNEIR